MKKYVVAAFLLSAVLAACGQRGAGIPQGPSFAQSVAHQSIGRAVPPNTIGIELPSEGVGTVKDVKYGLLGGYTQTTYSQVIAFKPGVTITLMNLSASLPHTLNVIGLKGFTRNPTLNLGASGGPMQKGYSSGIINPGKTVSVKLTVPGIYFVGCYFHYHSSPSMRDVIKVEPNATPGPQGTPPAV